MNSNELKKILVQHYKQQFSRHDGYSISWKTEQLDFSLAFLQTYKRKGGRANYFLYDKTGIEGSYEDIRKPKTLVPLESPALRSNRSIILGREGIGKTTYLKSAAYLWAAKEFWSEIELLIYIPLQNMGTSLPETVRRLYLLNNEEHSNPAQTTDVDAGHENHDPLEELINSDKTMIIFDGFEQLEDKNSFMEIAETTHRYILSARSTLMDQCPACCRYELLGPGVTPGISGIELFIDKFYRVWFSKERFSKVSRPEKNELILSLKKFIYKTPEVMRLLHSPALLEMLSTHWQLLNEPLSKMKHVGMSAFTTLLIGAITSPDDKSSIGNHKKTKRLFGLLGRMALKLILSNKPSFSRDFLLSEGLPSNMLEKTGIFKTTEHNTSNGTDNDSISGYANLYRFKFCHPLFQNYLAAYYLAMLKDDKLAKFVDSNKLKPERNYLLRLLAGLLDKKRVDFFFDLIADGAKDITGIYQLFLLAVCLEERCLDADIARKAEIIASFKQCLQTSLRDNENILGIVEKSADILTGCGFLFDEVATYLLTAMGDRRSATVRLSAARLLLRAGRLDKESDSLMPRLVSLIEKEENPWVKFALVELLGHVDCRPRSLFSLLSNIGTLEQNSIVWEAISSVMGQISSRDQTLLDRVLDDAENGDDNTRMRAVSILGYINKADPLVVNSIVLMLSTEKTCSVRQVAAESLGRLCNPDEFLLSNLLELLKQEQHRWVRKALVNTIGNIGIASITAIDPLIDLAENDPDSWVQFAAIEAIGKIGRFDPQIVHCMKSLVNSDNRGFVRQAAIRCIGGICGAGSNGGMGSDTQLLLARVLDSNKDNLVRCSAAAALLHADALLPDSIDILKTCCRDRNTLVASASLFTLSHHKSLSSIPDLELLLSIFTRMPSSELFETSCLKAVFEAFDKTENIQFLRFAYYKSLYELTPVSKSGENIMIGRPGGVSEKVAVNDDKAELVEWLFKEIRIT